MLREWQKSTLRIKGLRENGEWNINIKNCVWPPQNNTLTKRVVKGIFITRDWPFFFLVKCEMANFFPMNRDLHSSREEWFAKLFSVKQETKVYFALNCDFHHVWQLLLCNKWFCVTVMSRLSPIATMWLVWFSVNFRQPSFSTSVSSISTIMTEPH